MSNNSPSQTSATATDLALAHARFARAAIGIYLAAAAIAIALLVGLLTTERTYEEHQLREQLQIESTERAHHLSRYLGLLVQELRRLGLRSEVNLLDENLAPEKSLLQLSHQKSTFFNLGVAIVGVDGKVQWTEPESFLPRDTSFSDKPWFINVQRSRALHIVPVDPDRAEDSVLYVVSPVVRGDAFAGALLGAVDLKHGEELAQVGGKDKSVRTVLATQRGEIVYPPTPPAFARESVWDELFHSQITEPSVSTIGLSGKKTVVAASPVADTELVFMLLMDEDGLLQSARTRMRTRLAIALTFALLPLLVLVALLRRSLRTFRESEERAVREERLRLVGEAANLIAHEVRNSLNGIRMAAEIACGEQANGKERAIQELRGEIARLSDFAVELMTFSKGIAPRSTEVDLCKFVPKVVSLLEHSAAEAGVALELTIPENAVSTRVDPQLLHVVVANLVTNSIEAVGSQTSNTDPRVIVKLSDDAESVRLQVSDNGPGVSNAMKPHLFEPFQSSKPSGVGIGLALSKRIAVAHGGDLTLTEVPTGASFVLTLPKRAA